MSEQKDGDRDTLLGNVVGGAGRGEQVVRVNDHLWVSKDVSDSILLTTPEGNVVINTGMPGNGARHKQSQREISESSVIPDFGCIGTEYPQLAVICQYPDNTIW